MHLFDIEKMFMNCHPVLRRFGPRAPPAVSLPRRAIRLTVGCALLAFVAARTNPIKADILYDAGNPYTGEVIPGTAGIIPGPGIHLNLSGWDTTGHQLQFADLSSTNLTNASFALSDLTSASFYHSTVTNAIFTNAIVEDADFGYTTGFTANQLASTYSWKVDNLEGIGLEGNDVSGWSFGNEDLSGANFSNSTTTNANFAGAIIAGAGFIGTKGFTASQLYSTDSYIGGNLQGVGFGGNDLTGWNFVSQNLTVRPFFPEQPWRTQTSVMRISLAPPLFPQP